MNTPTDVFSSFHSSSNCRADFFDVPLKSLRTFFSLSLFFHDNSTFCVKTSFIGLMKICALGARVCCGCTVQVKRKMNAGAYNKNKICVEYIFCGF